MHARSLGKTYDVIKQGLVDGHLVRLLLQRGHFVARQRRLHLLELGRQDLFAQDAFGVLTVRIADLQAHQEAVELGFQ